MLQALAALCLGTVSPANIYMTGLVSQPIWKNSENRTFFYLVASLLVRFSRRTLLHGVSVSKLQTFLLLSHLLVTVSN
jgi:hypothetical protein